MCSDTTLQRSTFAKLPVDTKIMDERQQESIKNLYEVNSIFLDGVKEFKSEDYKDAGFYFAMCFMLSLVFSVIILALSFINKFKLIIAFSVGNLISSFLMTVLFYYDGGLEEFSQIKFGYYLFILNTVALIVFSRKQIQATNIN